MSTDATIGYGSKFQIDATGGGTYTDVAQVEEITPPDEETTKVDISHLQSPSATKEKKAGMIDPGDAEFKMIFTKAQLATLRGYRNTRNNYPCKILLSDGVTSAANGSTYTFSAFISSIAGEIPLDDKVMSTIKLTITGPVTFTAGT